MFTLNGNRRPHVVATLQVLHGRGGATFYHLYQFFRGFQKSNRLSAAEQIFSKKSFSIVKSGFDLKHVDIKHVDWKSTISEYDIKDFEVLYTTQKEKGWVTVNVYVLPNELLAEKPKQEYETFHAVLNPEATVVDTRLNRSPVVPVFKVVVDGATNYYKSLSEALFVEPDKKKIKEIKAVTVDGTYFEIKDQIHVKSVDMTVNRVVAFHEDKVDKSKKTFKAKITGLSSPVVLTKDVDSFKDGLYAVQGVVNGVIVVETLKSIVHGNKRTAHFIADTHRKYKEIIKGQEVVFDVK